MSKKIGGLMMYRLLIVVLTATLLAACSSVGRETHDIYTEIPDTSITMDTRGISEKAEDQPLFIEISDDGKTVDDADIHLEVWRAVEDVSTRESYPVSQRGDGIYAAYIDIDTSGLYFAKVDISAGDLKATPTEYFVVGDLNPQEHALLDEILPDEEDHTGGHH